MPAINYSLICIFIVRWLLNYYSFDSFTMSHVPRYARLLADERKRTANLMYPSQAHSRARKRRVPSSRPDNLFHPFSLRNQMNFELIFQPTLLFSRKFSNLPFYSRFACKHPSPINHYSKHWILNC